LANFIDRLTSPLHNSKPLQTRALRNCRQASTNQKGPPTSNLEQVSDYYVLNSASYPRRIDK